jgi:Domain of unknown function (DUF4893)
VECAGVTVSAFPLRFLPFLLLAAGCAKTLPPPKVPNGTTVTIAPADTSVSTDWTTLMLPEDVTRISLIDASWASALAEARSRRFGKAVDAEGPLLDPKVALSRPEPPPGRYRCRVIKLGLSPAKRGIGFARFKPFYCFIAVEGALLTFTKATGTQRPGGRLWDDGELRMVFMGGFDEGGAEPPAYGAAPKSNRVGVVERVDDFRWRLVTPAQSTDARIEIMELVPDTPLPTEAAQ